MRVLVSGAAGFVGSRLALALLQRGDEVLGFDNLDSYYPRAHKQRNLRDLLAFRNFRFDQVDLVDEGAMQRICSEFLPDSIAHIGALAAVRYSVDHPLRYGAVNAQGSLNLLEAARKVGSAKSVVLASTGSVYGSSTPVPFTEDAAADRPLAPYPASKRAMELYACTYHHLWQLPTTVLRFFNVYGPHGRPDMMPWRWTEQILAGEPLTLYNAGKIQRDWTYIDDIVAGFMAAMDTAPAGEIMNLGRGRPVANIRFVQLLEGLLGRRAIIRDVPAPPTEPLITFANVEKARELLGYLPQVDVEEGLARFVGWLTAERVI